MDIMHDRAGYYICWGCLVWVPAVYTSPAMYLTMHGVDNLSTPLTLAIACAGTAAIYINYDSDRQRQVSTSKAPLVTLMLMVCKPKMPLVYSVQESWLCLRSMASGLACLAYSVNFHLQSALHVLIYMMSSAAAEMLRC